MKTSKTLTTLGLSSTVIVLISILWTMFFSETGYHFTMFFDIATSILLAVLFVLSIIWYEKKRHAGQQFFFPKKGWIINWVLLGILIVLSVINIQQLKVG